MIPTPMHKQHPLPTPITILLLLLASTLFLLTAHRIYKLRSDPLRTVPGPFLARFTRLWYLVQLYGGKFEKVNVALHRRYGKVVRIAPDWYSIDDVEGARKIYGLGGSATFSKAPWYLAWAPPDPTKANLFSEIDTTRHAVQKRKYAAAYSMSSLVTYEPYVDNCSKMMVKRLSELAAKGTMVDLAWWLQCYAFDLIGEITYGKRFGLLDEGVDKEGILAAIDAAQAYSTHMGVYPKLHNLLFPLVATKRGIASLNAFVNTHVSDRLKEAKSSQDKSRSGPPDLVSKFLATHEENQQKMTAGDLMTISHSNVRAGSDTTGIALSSIFYYLLKYPAVLKKLRQEIDDAAVAGKDSEGSISFKEAQSLPYLQAVIKEALRIHSAVGLPLVRVVPEGGTVIAGREFPAKSTVGINSWVAHRNQAVYGTDADTFRPERWLEIEQEGRGAEVERYFFAFGQGSRTCLGKNISLLEISKLVPTLVQHFDFQLGDELVGEGRGWKTRNRWFVKPLSLEVRVISRRKES